MASNLAFLVTMLLLAIAFPLVEPSTNLGESIRCENLDKKSCSYAISSSGKRCVLEKHDMMRSTGTRSILRGSVLDEEVAYTCRTSEIEADRLRNWIETEQCIKACGLDRYSLGISSDSLLDPHFTHNLCSPHCYHSCPNVVDLYFNLAAAEGVFLPKLCEAQEENARRELMVEMKSSGFVAPGPVDQFHSLKHTAAEAPIMEPIKFTIAPAMSPY